MKKLLSFILVLNLTLAPLAFAEADTIAEALSQNSLLLQIKQKLAQVQYRHTLLQENVETAEESLLEIDQVVLNLELVIANLEDQIKKTEKQSLNVKSQKEAKTMDVQELEEDIQILELQLEDQKDLVGELLTLLYLKRDIYYDEEEVNPVKVLASPSSVSQTLQKLTYLDFMEAENQVQIGKLATLSTELAEKWSKLRSKKEELDKLDTRLQEELARLEGERRAQEELLEETLGEKAILEAMLGSAGDREEELIREIRIYEENVKMMEEKLAGVRGSLSDDQKELISKIEEEMIANVDPSEAADFLELDWPVSPENGLTALFHDESYKAAFGVEHYALDIRAEEESSIFAPADGVVSEVIYDESSTRYAYILIAHRKGVMTLYGHISAPAVSAGDYVTRGQIIGFTGGTPKTVGAGVRTTGPHLHFEVWQDGVRVDPLRYLPLDEVPLETLPEEYLSELQSDLEEEIKEIQELMGG